ncbi:MAG: hypothetical protein AB9836_12375 [Aminipila sp.]
MKIVCSECGHEFEPSNDMLKERPFKGQFLEIYYGCPGCGNNFRVCLHNTETKRLQKQVRIAEKAGNDTRKLKEKLKKELDRINGR